MTIISCFPSLSTKVGSSCKIVNSPITIVDSGVHPITIKPRLVTRGSAVNSYTALPFPAFTSPPKGAENFSGGWQVSIDWLQGVFTCPRVSLEAAVFCILGYTGGQAVFKDGQGDFHGHWWENTIFSSCGCKFWWLSVGDGWVRVLFGIPGQCFRAMPLDRHIQLLANLQHDRSVSLSGTDDVLFHGFTPTRIDCKVRVPASILDLGDIKEAGLDGNVAGCSPQSFRENSSGTRENRSTTLTFGSSQSDCQTVIYDPLVKHNISGAVDIEARLKDGKAVEFLSNFSDRGLLTSVSDFDLLKFSKFLCSVAVGQVRFIDRASGDRPCRCQLLSFWERFLVWLDNVPLKIIAPRPIKAFEKTLAWFVNQVLPSVSAIYVAWHNESFNFIDWIEDMINKKLARGLSPELMAMVKSVLERGDSFPGFNIPGYEMVFI